MVQCPLRAAQKSEGLQDPTGRLPAGCSQQRARSLGPSDASRLAHARGAGRPITGARGRSQASLPQESAAPGKAWPWRGCGGSHRGRVAPGGWGGGGAGGRGCWPAGELIWPRRRGARGGRLSSRAQMATLSCAGEGERSPSLPLTNDAVDCNQRVCGLGGHLCWLGAWGRH
jgi:hypothetical protein